MRPKHHRLQVGTGIGLGKRHGAGSPPRYERQIFLLYLLAGELVDGFGAVLQSPDILETGIAAGHHLVGHHEADERHVESFVLAGQVDTAQSGLADGIEVSLRTACIDDMVIHHPRSLLIDILGIGRYYVGAYSARYLQYAAVAVHRILEIRRCIVVHILVGEILLAQLHDFLHQRMIQVELQVFIV